MLATDDVRLVSVIPVGPNCDSVYVQDTVSSILTFCPRSRVIVVDDSGRGTGIRVAESFGALPVLCIPSGERPLGLRGGLYRTLSRGFSAALTEEFDLLLRIDTDALVAADGFVSAAYQMFEQDAHLGCVGIVDSWYDGARRSHSWPAKQLLRMMSPQSLISQTAGVLQLYTIVLRAIINRYRLGRSVFGGVCVYRHSAVQALRDKGFLDLDLLAHSPLEEDHIFGLLIAAAGYRMGDLNANYPGACAAAWRGLPDAPGALIESQASLIHSLKRWEGLKEAEIRETFRNARLAHGKSPS